MLAPTKRLKAVMRTLVGICLVLSTLTTEISAQRRRDAFSLNLAASFSTSSNLSNNQQSSLFFDGSVLTPSSTALWSGFSDFALSYPYVFCGMPHGLMVMDISSDTLPKIISMTLSESISEVELKGDYLFTLMRSGEYIRSLVIFDMANAVEPRIVGRLDDIGAPTDLRIVDNICYIGGSLTLLVVDVSDPNTPVPIGSLDLAFSIPNETIKALEVRDSLAFIVTGIGLEIINVAIPDSMYRVGKLETPGWVQNLAFSSNLLLLSDEPVISPPCILSLLHAVSYESPSLPVIVSTLLLPMGGIGKLVVSDSLAFVTNGTSGDLVIVNISDHTNMSIEGIFDGQGWASAVSVLGDKSYLTNSRLSVTDPFCSLVFPEGEEPGGFHIIDITGLGVPTELGEFHSPGFSEHLAASGDCLFVGGRVITKRFGGLKLVDVSHADSPLIRGSYNSQGSIMALAAEGDRIYLAQIDLTAPGVNLQCLAVSSGCQVSFLGEAIAGGFPHDISVNGGKVYLAHSNGLDVFGPQVPSAIVRLHTLQLPLGAGAVSASSNDIVYITTASNEFQIIDYSVPTNPNTISSINIGVYGCSMLQMDSSFVVVHENGFVLVNVTESTMPRIISSLDGLTGILDGALQGDFLFLSARGKGVFLADISDPLFPRIIDSIETQGEPGGLVTHRGYTYLADRQAILGFAPFIQTDVTDSESHEESAELDLRLFPGTPNPTSSRTSVSFYMPRREDISLDIYNVLGRHVATIATGVHGVGLHEYRWNGTTTNGANVASGIYFIRLRTETGSRTQKVVMMR